MPPTVSTSANKIRRRFAYRFVGSAGFVSSMYYQMFNIQLCIKMGAIRVVFTCCCWPTADTRKPLNFMASLCIAAAESPCLASIAHSHMYVYLCMTRYTTVINCNKRSQLPVTYVSIIPTRRVICRSPCPGVVASAIKWATNNNMCNFNGGNNKWLIDLYSFDTPCCYTVLQDTLCICYMISTCISSVCKAAVWGSCDLVIYSSRKSISKLF